MVNTTVKDDLITFQYPVKAEGEDPFTVDHECRDIGILSLPTT
ncbi:MAG: hypothetical protein AB7D06_00225 [Pedobacter sp.]